MRGPFVRVAVPHGHKDIHFLVNVLHLCLTHGSLYSFHRGNLAFASSREHGVLSSRTCQRSLRVHHGLSCAVCTVSTCSLLHNWEIHHSVSELCLRVGTVL